jgi:hypothetical protein
MEEAIEKSSKDKSIGGNLKIWGSWERGGGEGNKSLSDKWNLATKMNHNLKLKAKCINQMYQMNETLSMEGLRKRCNFP